MNWKLKFLFCLLVILNAFILTADEDVNLRVNRSFSQKTYKPGEESTVIVTLDIEYTGKRTDYPLNDQDNTEGYIIQVNYEEHYPIGCIPICDKKSDFSPKATDKEHKSDDQLLSVQYDFHYENEDEENVTRTFPLKYTYKIKLPATLNENLKWEEDSRVYLSYYKLVEGGLKTDVKAFQISGEDTILSENAPEKVYNVKYYSNNGINEEPFIIPELINGEYKTLKFEQTKLNLKDGYTFKNWNTKEDGTGEEYAEEAPFIIEDSDISFFAQWTEIEANKYEITYYGNGGVTQSGLEYYKSEAIDEGTQYILDNNQFIRKYYNFINWKDKNGKIITENSVIVNDNIDLYAQWSKKQVIVQYIPGEGAIFNAPLEINVEADTIYNITDVIPIKENNNFEGWLFNGTKVGSSIKIEESNIQLIAKWTENSGKSTIVYHRGADSVYFTTDTPEEIEVEVQSGEVTINGAIYFKSLGAMLLEGWTTEDVTNAPIKYKDNDTININDGETINLYASWKNYADLTLAGIVRPDFDFIYEFDENGELIFSEEELIFDSNEQRLNVSNNIDSLGNGKIIKGDTYLWFRMINYGKIDSGSFSIKATLTKENSNPITIDEGTIIRRVLSFENGEWIYTIKTEDYNNGNIKDGLTSDGNLWEHALVRLNLKELEAGQYTINVYLDCNKSVTEVSGTDNNGNIGGGELDNEFSLSFNVENVEYIVEYSDNIAKSLGLINEELYKKINNEITVQSPKEVFSLDIIRLYEYENYESYTAGFKVKNWKNIIDESIVEPGITVNSNLQLIAHWEPLPLLWFYPVDGNSPNSVPANYIKISQNTDKEILEDSKETFVNFNVVNYESGNASPFRVSLIIKNLNNNETVLEKFIEFNEGLASETLNKQENVSIGRLSAGNYSLTCMTDCDNIVIESDEREERVLNGQYTFYKKLTQTFVVNSSEQNKYILTVIGGTPETGEYDEGQRVQVTANAPAEGTRFECWTAEGIKLADVKAETQTFDMPANNVTLTANFVPLYNLTVIGGTPESGKYAEDDQVEVTANTAPEGTRFDGWTAEGITLADAKAETQTFDMPANDVTLTATFVPLYTLTVVEGTPESGKYAEGDEVEVTANAAPEGMKFDTWIAEGITITDLKVEHLSFTMPANDVTLTATYKPIYTVIIVNGKSNGETEFTACEGDNITVVADDATDGKAFDKWISNDVEIVNATDNPLTFKMPAQDVTITAIFGYDEWPEDLELYTPKEFMHFKENSEVTFSWPRIRRAAKYMLTVTSYDGTKKFNTIIDENTFTFEGLDADSYVWNVTALNEDETVKDAGTSSDFHYGVINGNLVIIDGLADGNSIRLAYDTMVEGYSDGAYAYQIFFFSLNTRTWTVLEKTLQVVDGQTVIDLGVNAANGYLYISPITKPESNFIEMYIE